MRYSIAVACLFTAQAPSNTHAFQRASNNLAADLRSAQAITSTPSPAQQQRQIFRHGVSAYIPASEMDNSNNNNNNTTRTYLANLVTNAVQTDDDAEEIELAERRRKVTERSGSFRVTLPLIQKEEETVSQPSTIMGMTLRQFYTGQQISSQILNLDTLVIESLASEENPSHRNSMYDNAEHVSDPESISVAIMQERLAPNISGVYVSRVEKGGPAWNAGIRPGDVLASTAATFGDAMWPKTTLEGVKSALSSRKMISGSATFEFVRTDVQEAVSTYELTLTRPIGLNLRETNDGYVEVVGFTANAPTLVKSAVLIGDRVIAVDSNLGTQMWPVSTVEGVISACTARLPGQKVTLKFERPQANIGDEAVLKKTMAAAAEASAIPQKKATATGLQQQQQKVAVAGTKDDEKELLKRCQDILRRYDQDKVSSKSTQRTAQFYEKFRVPALVADKVTEALAKASVSLDSMTLSMIMDAYLSSDQPNDAIKAFEAAVGLNGNGSILPPPSASANNGDTNQIKPNLDALNVYTISSLLKAHAMKHDLKSVRRVIAAMEGKGGQKVSGLETSSWPGTGDAGVIVPDTRCYNIAISAAAKVQSADGMQLVMQLFNSMSDPSLVLKPDKSRNPEKTAVTYNAVISALTLAGKYEDAFTMFANMKHVGLRPDKFTYTSLLKACVNDGDLQELLYDMREQGVEGDVVLFNTMIRSLCEDGKMSEARRVVTQMETRGIAADSNTYVILMKGLLESGKPGACLALFESACNNKQTSGLSENLYMSTTAVTAASMLGDHERALDLVSRMSAFGIKPNLKTLTSLMGACLASERPDLAAQVYKRIDNPDGYAMVQGIRAYCKSGDVLAAAKLLSTQKRGDRILSGKHLMEGYETIITTTLQGGDYDMARTMFTELLAKSYIPSKATLRQFVSAMGLTSNGRLVLEYKERSPEQFQYLLFLIDSIQQRKLAVDAFLYSAAIACGNQLGGWNKEIATLMVQARALGDEESSELLSSVHERDHIANLLFSRWEELLKAKEEAAKLSSDPALLPSLNVPVGKRDAATVMFAEKFMARTRNEQAKKDTAKAFS